MRETVVKLADPYKYRPHSRKGRTAEQRVILLFARLPGPHQADSEITANTYVSYVSL
jgi:hypothetical protein